MRILYIVPLLLIISGLCSCKKLDYDSKFTTFADIFFLNNSVNTDLQVKYGGSPIAWDKGSGKIHTVQGEGSFEFYDKKSGLVYGEKKINIISGSPEKIMVFQPLKDSPISFLDPEAQANEPAPSQGYMKIKIANCSPGLLPYEKTDILIIGITSAFEFKELTIMESVGVKLDKENYHLVPTGGNDIIAWTFLFMEHGTGKRLKNAGGDDYINVNTFLYPEEIQPKPEKNIYTLYLTPIERTADNMFLKVGTTYYDIHPSVLFTN